jgi:hypothetical protein
MSNKSDVLEASIQIDARGARFSALITAIVFSAALLTQSAELIVWQAAIFAIGAFRGPQFTPYALIFRTVVKPRLKSNPVFEDVRPPKFAQAVGLAFTIIALVGSVAGSAAVFSVAVAFALAAAFLNFAFNYCLGCQFYLLGVRLVNPRNSKITSSV